MLRGIFQKVQSGLKSLALDFAISGDSPDAKALRELVNEKRFGNITQDAYESRLDDVIYTAGKFEFTSFEDDPQAAIEKALEVLAYPKDLDGEKITVQAVMEHAGLDYQQDAYSPHKSLEMGEPINEMAI